ncbi:MAG: hypothetical protein F6K54_22205 [Okeania sp. SIO3B5]|uniref:hypothetical protein n=1 Tax=Okeania sp. SIO3B5 TaxID=2607811 RepID=UPI0013FF898F|nr:hypothetical protein [Okeania sp. SIO3B5]NEO55544.1 hypothetical protein [Okeania sp. SIO3B5]
MSTQLRGYLENISLGIIAGILTNFITALIVNYFQPGVVAIKQYKTISTAIFILITPIIFNYLLQKLDIDWSKIALVSLISIMLLESIFFSAFPTKEININQYVTLYPEYSEYFEGVALKRTDYNKVWTHDAKIGVLKNQLHILLQVEWKKEEKMKGLRRNYGGYIYYQMDVSDSSLRGRTETTTKIINYSFRPARGILSYIIGFIDTGYLIKRTNINDLTSKIEEIVKENRILEKIREGR